MVGMDIISSLRNGLLVSGIFAYVLLFLSLNQDKPPVKAIINTNMATIPLTGVTRYSNIFMVALLPV
jgi:hypothetical protein